MHKKYRKTATRNFIKFFILFISLYWLCGCNRLMAQAKDSLIADETTYTELKSKLMVETGSPFLVKSLFEIILQVDNAEMKVHSFMIAGKKYYTYRFYFRKEDQPLIDKWIKTIKS